MMRVPWFLSSVIMLFAVERNWSLYLRCVWADIKFQT